MEYEVKITELLQTTVAVEAKSRSEAMALVKSRYDDGDYVLDAGDFQGVSFKPVRAQHDIGNER